MFQRLCNDCPVQVPAERRDQQGRAVHVGLRSAFDDVLEVPEQRFDDVAAGQQGQGGHFPLDVHVPCQPCLQALFHFGAFGELFRQPVALVAGGLAEALAFDDFHGLRHQPGRVGEAQDERLQQEESRQRRAQPRQHAPFPGPAFDGEHVQHLAAPFADVADALEPPLAAQLGRDQKRQVGLPQAVGPLGRQGREAPVRRRPLELVPERTSHRMPNVVNDVDRLRLPFRPQPDTLPQGRVAVFDNPLGCPRAHEYLLQVPGDDFPVDGLADFEADALAVLQPDRPAPVRQRVQTHPQDDQSLLGADVDGMVDDRQPGGVHRLDLPEQPQAQPQRPVDDRGEMRHPAAAECRGRAEQAEYPRDAAVRHHRLHHQQDAQRTGCGGRVRHGSIRCRQCRFFPPRPLA